MASVVIHPADFKTCDSRKFRITRVSARNLNEFMKNNLAIHGVEAFAPSYSHLPTVPLEYDNEEDRKAASETKADVFDTGKVKITASVTRNFTLPPGFVSKQGPGITSHILRYEHSSRLFERMSIVGVPTKADASEEHIAKVRRSEREMILATRPGMQWKRENGALIWSTGLLATPSLNDWVQGTWMALSKAAKAAGFGGPECYDKQGLLIVEASMMIERLWLFVNREQWLIRSRVPEVVTYQLGPPAAEDINSRTVLLRDAPFSSWVVVPGTGCDEWEFVEPSEPE
ncbi:MAG: hypothetical protein M4579_004690 [Chaenotheca gracillima]|nr:MAG: hypothetical protein M4579_004690 [Chaenotheca gracillima]